MIIRAFSNHDNKRRNVATQKQNKTKSVEWGMGGGFSADKKKKQKEEKNGNEDGAGEESSTGIHIQNDYDY